MPVRHTQAVSSEPKVPPSADDEPKLSDEELKAIGKRVREARDIVHITQTALADEIGISQNYVSRLEGGDRQASLAVLVRIAEALGQPVGWIAKDEGPGPVARPTVNWEQRDQRKRRDPGSE